MKIFVEERGGNHVVSAGKCLNSRCKFTIVFIGDPSLDIDNNLLIVGVTDQLWNRRMVYLYLRKMDFDEEKSSGTTLLTNMLAVDFRFLVKDARTG